jgi:glycosyltransferase involved in cell wall biosynthesis
VQILLAHNYYQQPGGEQQSFAAKGLMLESHGDRVIRYTLHNKLIKEMNPLSLAARTLWNKNVASDLRKLIDENNPDIVHFQNTFPLISPSAYYAVKGNGIPVIQTLRNYRLICPNALLFRDGLVCEDCIGKFIPWPGIVRSCYRKSFAATGVTTAMLTLHRLLRTYSRMVDCYIALTNFAREKFIEGGIPARKVVVKPNFVHPDPGIKENVGSYAIFVGRFSPEKDIKTLLESWKNLNGVALKMVGDGPLMIEVKKEAEKMSNVKVLGQREHKDTVNLIKNAKLLVFPSRCYEGFPVAICEAFACGVPVIASNFGAMAEIVEDGRTGLHFTPGNPEDLAKKIEWAWTHEKRTKEMGKEARKEYERKYTAEINYKMLIDIYETAIERAREKTDNSNIDK